MTMQEIALLALSAGFALLIGSLSLKGVFAGKPWLGVSINIFKSALFTFFLWSGLVLLLRIWSPELSDPPVWARWWVALFLLVGHLYSPWKKFAAGNGIDTALGSLLILSPISGVAALVGASVIAAHTYLTQGNFRLSSSERAMAVLVGMLTAVVFEVVLHVFGVCLFFGGAMVLLLLIRYETDIDHLLNHPARTE